MSSTKQKVMSASKAAGAAIVVLSGFVPMPNLQNLVIPGASGNIRGGAMAASLPIGIGGSAISGITFGATNALKFGTLVGTGNTGTFGVKTDGGTTGVAGAKKVAGQANADVVYTAKVAAPIDIKVSKIGVITLTGAGATGKVAHRVVNFGANLGAAALKLTATAAGTTAQKTNYAASKTTGADLNIGGTLKWSGLATPPVGNIPAATNMVITITY